MRIVAAGDRGGEGGRCLAEVREHEVQRLNEALVRMGMYGGEMALTYFLEDLLYLDAVDDGWAHVRDGLDGRGAWSCTGLTGAVQTFLGTDSGRHTESVQLTFADIVHQRGYLCATRWLTAAEYTDLRAQARGWARGADRSIADMVATYRPPSREPSAGQPAV